MYFLFTIKHKETKEELKYFFNANISNQKEADVMIDVVKEGIRRDLHNIGHTRDMYGKTIIERGEYRKFSKLIEAGKVKFIEFPGYVQKNLNPTDGKSHPWSVNSEPLNFDAIIDWDNMKDPYIPFIGKHLKKGDPYSHSRVPLGKYANKTNSSLSKKHVGIKGQ